MLELRGLTKHFGGVRAVDGVDLAVAGGEILGLIGPNGSGKSTVVNLVCGLFPLTAGSVSFRGTDISNLPPHERVALGVARTFQNIRLFGQLTVWQNLWAAQNSAEQRSGEGFFAAGSAARAAPAPRSTARWNSSISRTSATSSQATWRSASSGGSNSPARLPPIPRFCCSTSRRQA